ncbi:MAG: AI-2E family transporter [Campylobacterota bacterium]|nr:AI-2E family transporter [Campylobacterota bacterium]
MSFNTTSKFFIVSASIIIVLAGIKIASPIIVTFLLSLFIATIFAPLFEYLNSKRIPESLSLVIVISVFILFITVIGVLLGSSIQDFSSNISTYSQKLEEQLLHLTQFLNSFGLHVSLLDINKVFNPAKLLSYFTSTLKGITSLFADGFVILLIVAFLLLEASQFGDKIKVMHGEDGAIKNIANISEKIKHYMALKAIISLLTGVVVSIFLAIMGVDFAILFGAIAFLLNFIPNIGSIIAAIPAVLLAFIQLGSTSALVVAGVYVAINIVLGSIIEPKVMGRGLGLSTLVVFLSLIFWGWLLGPVGMLLSIPLTIMFKIVMDTKEETKWISVLLSSSIDIKKESK